MKTCIAVKRGASRAMLLGYDCQYAAEGFGFLGCG